MSHLVAFFFSYLVPNSTGFNERIFLFEAHYSIVLHKIVFVNPFQTRG